METPLHPTPMQRPMMKGEIYVDASNKPMFQGIWGMTHADVNKNGLTNDFKVMRVESVKEQERGLPVFPGNYLGYFKLTTGFQTETVNDSFTLTFREHSNHGYNVYGFGENRFGKTEIVGTVTQTGKMEIFKMIPGMTVQPDPNETPPPLPRLANARAVSLPPPPPIARPLVGSSRAGHSAGGARPKPSGSAKKKPQKEPLPPPPDGATTAEDDVELLGSVGGSHLPHHRFNCPEHEFVTGDESKCMEWCKKCFCYVCDRAVSECVEWPNHCQATNSGPEAAKWRSLRENACAMRHPLARQDRQSRRQRQQQLLEGMGFAREMVETALKEADWNVIAAVEYLVGIV